jgi:hypothetical protein
LPNQLIASAIHNAIQFGLMLQKQWPYKLGVQIPGSLRTRCTSGKKMQEKLAKLQQNGTDKI